jgi:hypothetical protein
VETLILWLEAAPIWVLALVMFGLFAMAVQFGRALGNRQGPKADDGDPGLLVSASLGLMALLLGFTVSMAVARYDERRTVMVAEGNAIGTFVYRTDLMPAGQQAQVRAALADYVAARVDVGRQNVTREQLADARGRQAVAQQRVWQGVVDSSSVVPDGSYRMLIVGSANDMFDMAAARDIALETRLPATLVLLLLFFPLASMVLIGYVSGRSARAHALASFEMILLLTLVLALIADLNRPRRGTILTPQDVMLAAQDQLRDTRARAAEATRTADTPEDTPETGE